MHKPGQIKEILNPPWIVLSLLFGANMSWLLKDRITPFLLSGKTFEMRSLFAQIAIILFIVLFTALLFLVISYLSSLLSRNIFGVISNKSHRLKNNIIEQFQSDKIQIILILLFSSLLVWCIFGKIIGAKWSLIDDHEIINFLGSDSKLYFHEIFSLLSKTEAGAFGLSLRFRPSYYFLRLLETAIWGNNPMLWYAFRIILLILSISIFWRLIEPVLGWLLGGMVCAYVLSFYFWTDIMGRLGPAETYSVIALPIYIWGVVNIIRAKRTGIIKRILTGLSILIGSMICIGSKENFLVLMLPNFFLFYFLLKRKDFILLPFISGSILFGLFVGSSIFLATSRSGVDIYNSPLSIYSRVIVKLPSLISQGRLAPFFILCQITVIICVLIPIRGFSKEKHKAILYSFFWMVGLCILYLSQLIFYNGFWPTGTRYDYPGLLYIPACILILYWLIKNLFGNHFNKGTEFVIKGLLILDLIILIMVNNGYSTIISEIEGNVIKSSNFTNQLERIVSTLKQNEDYALVLEVGDAGLDYEPVFSYERFLRFYQVKNKLFLRIQIDPLMATKYTGLNQVLYEGLLSLSNNGRSDSFEPLKQLAEFGNHCFSLNLSGNFQTECEPNP